MIIGSSLEAMVTAFKYEIPILGNIENKPLPHHYIPVDLDLSPIHCQNKIEKFTYLSNKVEKRGMPAIELWDIMFYRLSIMGLAPFWGSWNSIMDEGMPQHEKLKTISLLHKNKTINLTFDNLIVFDYPRYVNGEKIYLINDYIDINTVYDFPHNLFLSKNCDFLETLSYETLFFKRTAKLYGCCVKSIISGGRLENWDTSQTSIRMNAEKDIFWNIDKNIKISLNKRVKAPLLTKMCESLEDIIHNDIMDQEVYD